MRQAGRIASASRSPLSTSRLAGIDIARAMAMALMFLAHYGATVDDGPTADGWTSSLVRMTDGRAMPLFVLLSGAGFALLARRPPVVGRVLGRAAMLLVVGLWLDGGLVAPILQYYALYLVVGLFVMRLDARLWLPLAAAVTAVGALVSLYWLDHFPDAYRIPSDSGWSALGALKEPWPLCTTLAFTGVYPLFPSFAFFLVGMWLARRNLRAARVQLALVLAGTILAVAAYGLGWTTDDQRVGLAARSDSLWRLLSAAGHSNMPVWVLAASGFSMALVGLASWLAPRLGRVGEALARTGRLALTFYVAHVWLIRRPLRHWPWELSDHTILLLVGLSFAVFVVVADQWLDRLAYGPLEALLRLPDVVLGANRRA